MTKKLIILGLTLAVLAVGAAYLSGAGGRTAILTEVTGGWAVKPCPCDALCPEILFGSLGEALKFIGRKFGS